MYNFGGVRYNVFRIPVPVLGISLLLFILSRIFAKHAKDDTNFTYWFPLRRFCALVILGSILAMSVLGYLYQHPKVEHLQGKYTGEGLLESERVNPDLFLIPPPDILFHPGMWFTTRYRFVNPDTDQTIALKLDGKNKEEIFPGKLIAGVVYDVYYEDYSNVIVGLKEADSTG